jgi:hypothetical protein
VNEPHPHTFFLVLVGGHPLKNSTGMDHSPNFLAQIEKNEELKPPDSQPVELETYQPFASYFLPPVL